MELGKPWAGKPPARFDEGSEAKAAAQPKCLPPPTLLAYSNSRLSTRHMEPAFFFQFATTTIAVAVGLVAVQQWLLARHKFRLDLFEKRYKVYDAAGRFLSIILSLAGFTDDDLRTYNIGTMDAVFLYPKRIKAYIDEIRRRALDMRLYQTQFSPLPVGDERSKLVQKHHDEIIWLNDQLTKLPNIFSPYLGFASVK